MKTEKRLISALTIAFAMVLSSNAFAQTGKPDAVKTVAASDVDMTSGEVRKVDKEAKKITLKHEDIKNLDMPGMTMVFQVKDAALLDKTKVGDKVRFKVIKEGNAYVVIEIKVKE